MNVSELARRTGVSVHRLRRYEAQGLIRAERRPSGYREFADSVVREVIFIAMGRDLGFTLDDLADALPRYRAGTLTVEQMVGAMQQRIAEVDGDIASLRALRKKLVAHVAWLDRRKREAARRLHTPPAWPDSRPSRKASR